MLKLVRFEERLSTFNYTHLQSRTKEKQKRLSYVIDYIRLYTESARFLDMGHVQFKLRKE